MEYNVELIRTSRRSLSISVSYDNRIVVRCPRSISLEKCQQYFDSKKTWLDKIVRENNAVMRENSDILEFNKIYVNGVKLPLIVSDKNKITDDAVYVKDIKYIRRTFIKRFSEEFENKARQISQKINLPAAGYSFKTYRGRWGCCDSKKNIVFNYMLFMLPPELQVYVIVHELCHTVYFNHSTAFWNLVARFIPDYREMKKQLKKFDFITKLY